MWVFQLAGLLLVPFIVAVVAALFRKWWLAGALVALVPLKLFVEKAVVKQLGAQGIWLRSLDDPHCLRACTHLSTTAADIGRLIEALQGLDA